MNIFIALAKGELGKQIEAYMQAYGFPVRLEGRPLNFKQRVGKFCIRPMQSKDVTWYVAKLADYGITGEDLVLDYNSCNGEKLKILKKLGFGKGDIVLFSKKSLSDLGKNRIPIIAAPYYYKNIAQTLLRECLSEFNDCDILDVNGSTEGFVVDETADMGIDFTTYFTKPEELKEQTTLSANGLTIVKRLMPTEAVVVSKNCQDYTLEEFERIFGQRNDKSAANKE